MKRQAQLVVVRHAQTVANLAGAYLAESDKLSSVGRLQAACLASALGKFAISHVLHSGSVRVIETLRFLSSPLTASDVRADSRLREGAVGAWTGRQGDMRANEARRQGLPIWQVRPLGGESWVDIDSRLGTLVDDEIRNFTGLCLLLLGSGRTNSLVLRRLCRTSWDAYDPRQMMHASVSTLRSVTDSSLDLDQSVDHLPVNLWSR